MTIFSIAQNVARNTGYDVPQTAVNNQDREYINIVEQARLTAVEMARRFDWPALTREATFAATGLNTFALPQGFARVAPGSGVLANGAALRGGLSTDEWSALPVATGAPRFVYLTGTHFKVWPTPAEATTIVLRYQSKFWCSNGTDNWALDTDSALFSEDAITLGAIWRIRRHLGKDFQDNMAEYEAALSDYTDHAVKPR